MKKLLFVFSVLLLVGAGCASSDSSINDSLAPSVEDDSSYTITPSDYDGVIDVFSCMADTEVCEDTAALFENGQMTELLIGLDWTEVVAACEGTYCYAIDYDDFEWEVLILE